VHSEFGGRKPRIQSDSNHLKMAMRKIWRQNGGNKGIVTHAAAKKYGNCFE